nr:HNH endonuclease [Fredinandcohnia onubensis]
MNPDELIKKIENLSIWKKGGQRAPHKPLLLLLALGQLQSKKSNMFLYEDIKPKLTQLLIDFGPIRKSYHPEEPFVRLTRDGIWQLSKDVNKSDPSNKVLLQNEIAGGFTSEVVALLHTDPSLLSKIAQIILEQHFPDTIHEDILAAVGLDLENNSKRKRDPKFRERILRAYGYCCAICGFNVRLSHTLVGVEAAHIKWHQAGGPDSENNGIALCSLHHKLFDRGVFTISDRRQMIVSQEAHGSHGFEEWLMKYHGEIIREPIETYYNPDSVYLGWHIREVFRGPERYVIN